ncbi:chemotaxis protein CheW [Massilia sp. MB5]|uniref:chemotaxis protein CheW n=1 Tax=unclassified Massilia TaxID=2609279 RepID=UPI00067CC358|nr:MULTISPECIES: chemotaxis protein CheW [unclassified Massilia]AKU23910.1 type IV pili signal transduction protein [Massilia sp. NR 4-1]UMR31137.1 chemotaxis protein CheW [Massilia sp. MB5]
MASAHGLGAAAPDGAERRSRLRQYQVQLLERMQAAKGGAGNAGRELGVQAGALRGLLDLTQIGEIVPCQALTPVPLAQDWYLGLANIRGNLTGVVDLARYLGEAPCAPEADSRFITFAPALGYNCALLVARVLGLRRLDEMREGAAAAAEAQPWCAQQFEDKENQVWTRLDLGLLVREARFQQAGR